MTEPRAAVIGYGYAGRSFHSYLIAVLLWQAARRQHRSDHPYAAGTLAQLL